MWVKGVCGGGGGEGEGLHDDSRMAHRATCEHILTEPYLQLNTKLLYKFPGIFLFAENLISWIVLAVDSSDNQ